MREASNTPSGFLMVAAWVVVVIASYAFTVFAFATSDYVRGDIPGWQDGLLTATFLFGFAVTALLWVWAIWLTGRRYGL